MDLSLVLKGQNMRIEIVCLALASVGLWGCGARVLVTETESDSAAVVNAVECVGEDDCDDGDPCTADRCSPDGECAHSPIGNCVAD